MAMITDDASGPQPAVLIAVKVVPGAKRDEIVGPLGDRLKIRVTAPPEDGKANKAICGLLAETLGVRPRDITIARGPASPEKSVRVAGIAAAEARRRLGVEPRDMNHGSTP